MKTCKTCEHNDDKGQEYCGTCASGIESNWSEAGWIKDKKIKELTGLREKLLNIVLDDVPHRYQKRLLEVLNEKI